jgi:hypothetical protein
MLSSLLKRSIRRVCDELTYICVLSKSQDKFLKYYLKLGGYDMEGLYDLQECLSEDLTDSFFVP